MNDADRERIEEFTRHALVEMLKPTGLFPEQNGELIAMDEAGRLQILARVPAVHRVGTGHAMELAAEVTIVPAGVTFHTGLTAIGRSLSDAMEACLHQWIEGILAPVLVATNALPAERARVGVITYRTERYGGGGTRWRICAGPLQVSTPGGKPILEQIAARAREHPIYKLLLNPLSALEFADERPYHAVRAAVSRNPDQTIRETVTLDNEVWPAGEAAVRHFLWPDYDGLMAVQQFLVVRRMGSL
ncbi:MAG: hypothetical protein GYB64_17470 [Chloroflexi bacterium]|nr:hypothetical protein [Chloroflexota bacterium]